MHGRASPPATLLHFTSTSELFRKPLQLNDWKPGETRDVF